MLTRTRQLACFAQLVVRGAEHAKQLGLGEGGRLYRQASHPCLTTESQGRLPAGCQELRAQERTQEDKRERRVLTQPAVLVH
jgi:hypothetical protein